MTGPAPPPRGLTLIELVVVLAIFALVAVMGLQALTGGLRAQERLVLADADAAALLRGITLLRHDLKAAVPQAFHPPGGDAEPALLAAAPTGFALSLAGQPRLPDEPVAGFSRVIWQLDTASGQLTRQVWPLLRPATDAALTPRTIVLEGVSAWDLRVFRPETGWQTATAPAADAPLGVLPAAIELRLELARIGPLRLLVRY